MAIEDRTLVVAGIKLIGRYKNTEYTCTVEAGEGDKLAFVLADGQRFDSISSAASAFMEGKSRANGWDFWSLEGTEIKPRRRAAAEGEPKTPKAAKEPKAPKAPKEPKVKAVKEPKAAKPKRAGGRRKNAKSGYTPIRQMEDGRWFCDACMNAFEFEGEGTPEQCPNGHSAGSLDSFVTGDVAGVEESEVAVEVEVNAEIDAEEGAAVEV